MSKGPVKSTVYSGVKVDLFSLKNPFKKKKEP